MAQNMTINDKITEYNLKPSKNDSRDYRFSTNNTNIRPIVDLRLWDSLIESQGSLGSCTGHAITSAYELMVKSLYADKFTELSRLFVYYNSRIFDGYIDDDNGAYLRDSIKSAYKYGMCKEALWPYNIENFDKQPTPECYIDAQQRTITKYETLYGIEEVTQTLNSNKPVVSGIYVYSGFSELNNENNTIPWPFYYESPIGGHAISLVGYDIKNKYFIFKNSFGESWGSNGYGRMTFDYFTKYSFENWSFDISSQPALNS